MDDSDEEVGPPISLNAYTSDQLEQNKEMIQSYV